MLDSKRKLLSPTEWGRGSLGPAGRHAGSVGNVIGKVMRQGEVGRFEG